MLTRFTSFCSLQLFDTSHSHFQSANAAKDCWGLLAQTTPANNWMSGKGGKLQIEPIFVLSRSHFITMSGYWKDKKRCRKNVKRRNTPNQRNEKKVTKREWEKVEGELCFWQSRGAASLCTASRIIQHFELGCRGRSQWERERNNCTTFLTYSIISACNFIEFLRENSLIFLSVLLYHRQVFFFKKISVIVFGLYPEFFNFSVSILLRARPKKVLIHVLPS